ncbi:hypothetical protein GCM10010232_67700 [Streptomyces amakusaensis]|uniref:SdpA family antimicrobial peptide system protein n=1 Tax=Streptomyces amakusaensis TaxID=67271 RepID=A0ABW0ASI2_9ACTN
MRFIEKISLQVTAPVARTSVPRNWVFVTAAIWVLVAFYLAQAFLPKNIVRLPAQDAVHDAALVVAPQGWAFFTRSARSSEYVPFGFSNGAWNDLRLAPHARASNAFGLDRASRSQGIENALLLHEKGLVWQPCGNATSAAECLKKTPVTSQLKNRSPSPSICGRSAMVEMKPVPWAWRDLLPGTHTPVRAAVWDVEC